MRLRATAFVRNAAPAVRQLLRGTGIGRLSGMRHRLPGESAVILQGRDQHGVRRRSLLLPCGIVHLRMNQRFDKQSGTEIGAIVIFDLFEA